MKSLLISLSYFLLLSTTFTYTSDRKAGKLGWNYPLLTAIGLKKADVKEPNPVSKDDWNKVVSSDVDGEFSTVAEKESSDKLQQRQTPSPIVAVIQSPLQQGASDDDEVPPTEDALTINLKVIAAKSANGNEHPQYETIVPNRKSPSPVGSPEQARLGLSHHSSDDLEDQGQPTGPFSSIDSMHSPATAARRSQIRRNYSDSTLNSQTEKENGDGLSGHSSLGVAASHKLSHSQSASHLNFKARDDSEDEEEENFETTFPDATKLIKSRRTEEITAQTSDDMCSHIMSCLFPCVKIPQCLKKKHE